MLGVLRVVPCEGSTLAHRALVLRRTPSESLLKDIVGGKLALIQDFDTTLYKREAVRCVAFRARTRPGLPAGTKEENRVRSNTYANLLWLQAQVRKKGFSGVNLPPHSIVGPVAILHGDEEFLRSLIETLLRLNEEAI